MLNGRIYMLSIWIVTKQLELLRILSLLEEDIPDTPGMVINVLHKNKLL